MAAIPGVPHPFPYQGSKRQLAGQILACIPKTDRLIEPFAGSAAISLAAAYKGRGRTFVLNDAHEAIALLWKAIIARPERLALQYRRLWLRQQDQERAFYDVVRTLFNRTHKPHYFLYLLARCVKATVRYNSKGEFNNSPDNRRKGMRPDDMEDNILRSSQLLRGRTEVHCRDYREFLRLATPRDVVYMDPPYQGVCGTHNHRYCASIDHRQFIDSLADLNRRKVSFLISYDGRTGDKTHGEPLPMRLGLVHREIRVGRSTQATLLGRDHDTYESIYLSPALVDRLGKSPEEIMAEAPEPMLFAIK